PAPEVRDDDPLRGDPTILLHPDVRAELSIADAEVLDRLNGDSATDRRRVGHVGVDAPPPVEDPRIHLWNWRWAPRRRVGRVESVDEAQEVSQALLVLGEAHLLIEPPPSLRGVIPPADA